MSPPRLNFTRWQGPLTSCNTIASSYSLKATDGFISTARFNIQFYSRLRRNETPWLGVFFLYQLEIHRLDQFTYVLSAPHGCRPYGRVILS